MALVTRLENRRFGRLLVLSEHGRDKWGSAQWLCRCKCGKLKVANSGHLRKGRTTSCGCYRNEILALHRKPCIKHGGCGTPAYGSWEAMNGRCRNPNSDYWKNYGGRGIKVCRRWRGKNGFANFLADMGPRPADRTLDRKNVNGNYTPRNCRWATHHQQATNKRRAPAYEADGYLAHESAAA